MNASRNAYVYDREPQFRGFGAYTLQMNKAQLCNLIISGSERGMARFVCILTTEALAEVVSPLTKHAVLLEDLELM